MKTIIHGNHGQLLPHGVLPKRCVMKRRAGGRSITRRRALGQMASAMAAALGVAGRGFAAEQPSKRCAIRLERQETGSEIWQVTTEEFPQSNIYCELPYCSRDSRYFVYERHNAGLAGDRTELMVVELGTWKQHRLDVCSGIEGSTISQDGVFYYWKRAGNGEQVLMRADLVEGSPEEVYRLHGGLRPASLGTVSADGERFAYGARLDDAWKLFGIVLVDLKQGRQEVIDRDPFILNPHPQFEPGQSKELLIQHNRGGTFTPEGKLERLVGPEGATLYLLSASDGRRTALQVGTPYTTACTGHEAWIGTSKGVLLSVAPSGDYAPEKGNLLGVRAGEPARVVGKGYQFNHVGVSRCGRFYCCDDWRGTYKVVIGSTSSGKNAVLCDSKTRPTSSQSTHPHAYLTPDLKWVIFNSNRSGSDHIHAASVPEGMIEKLS